MLVNVTSDRRFQAYLDSEEARLHPAMAGVLTAGARLQVNRGPMAAEAYVKQRGGPLLLKTYEKIYRDQFEAVAAPERKAAGGSVSEFMRGQLTYLQLEAAKKIVGISEGLRAQIAETITGMVEDGKGEAAIARSIRKLSPEIGRTRAATIARTETHNAALDAINQTLQFKKIDVKTKEWWANRDRRVRPTHRAAHGQKRPMAEPFEVGADKLMYPGDDSLGADAGEIINCRCAVLYETAEWQPPAEAVPPELPAEPPPESLPPSPKTADERAWNEQAFANSPLEFHSIVAKTAALKNITYETSDEAGAWWNTYADGSGSFINMGDYKKDRATGQTVWRHEYGHHFDHEAAVKDGSASKHGVRYWSQNIQAERLADEKALLAAQQRADVKLVAEGPRSIGDKVRAADDRLTNLVEGGMSPDAALRQVLGDVLPKRGFTADDFLTFVKPESSKLFAISTAVRLKEGDTKGALENIRAMLHSDHNNRLFDMVEDYLGATTVNKIGRGHKDSYYAEDYRMMGTEQVANYFAVAGLNEPKAKAMAKLLAYLAPRSWKAIAKKVKEAAGAA